MEPHALRLVTIITEAVIEKELVQELTGLGVSGYTISDVRGRGHRGVRDTGWEHGANIRLEVVCHDGLARAIAGRLKERYYDDYAMILYICDVEVLRPEKFEGEGRASS